MNPETKNQLYRLGPNLTLPAGTGVLISNAVNPEQHLIPAPIVNALMHCTTFKTLRDHAKDSWKHLKFREKLGSLKSITECHYQLTEEIILSPTGFPRMLETIYKKFAEQELLVSQDKILAWAANTPAACSQDRISSLGIMTRDRLPVLKRSLESYIENTKRWNRKIEFLIHDASPEIDTRKKYQETLAAVSQKHQAPIFYAGFEEKKEFAQKIAAAGIPAAAVNFALFDVYGFGHTYGVGRNAFLLDSAGQMVFSADDDTVCLTAKSPEYKEGLRFDSKGSAFAMWHYPDRDAVLRSVSLEDQDLLALHEKALGKSPGELIRNEHALDLLDFEKMSFNHLQMLQKGRGRTLITFNGTFGDSGSNLAFPPIFPTGPARKHVLRSEAFYQACANSREGCKAVNRMTVDKATTMMTIFMGMDNREILPPFFPVFRMEDAVFGHLLEKCAPETCFAYLPWVAAHYPMNERTFVPIDIEPFESFWPSDAIDACLQSFMPLPGKTRLEEELKNAGKYLMHCGSLPFSDYREMVIQYQRSLVGSKITMLENLLQINPGSPSYWVRDVKKVIAYSKKEANQKMVLAPVPFVKEMGQAEAEKRIQNLVYEFGELLLWWPAMIEAAKDLRRKGIRMSQPMHNNPQP